MRYCCDIRAHVILAKALVSDKIVHSPYHTKNPYLIKK